MWPWNHKLRTVITKIPDLLSELQVPIDRKRPRELLDQESDDDEVEAQVDEGDIVDVVQRGGKVVMRSVHSFD